MKKKRYYQIAAGSLAVLTCVSAYVFVFGSGCIHSLCHAYAEEEREIRKNDVLEETYFNTSPDRYNDPEYLEALEIVQREVERRESRERLGEIEAEASRERATQKAVELREEIKSGE